MKKLLKILPVVMVVCLVATSVFAVTVPNSSDLGTSAGSNTVKQLTQNIWGTVITIVRVLAVGCVVFAGLRYMFASADQKADIKKSMGILAIGSILVFGSTFILQLIAKVTNEVAGNAIQ